MDGIQAAEAIRQDCNIPVVYLTAYSDDNPLDRAKTTQPFGYLLKPFAKRELHTSIEVGLYKHKIDAEKARLEMHLHQARKMEAIAESKPPVSLRTSTICCMRYHGQRGPGFDGRLGPTPAVS